MTLGACICEISAGKLVLKDARQWEFSVAALRAKEVVKIERPHKGATREKCGIFVHSPLLLCWHWCTYKHNFLFVVLPHVCMVSARSYFTQLPRCSAVIS